MTQQPHRTPLTHYHRCPSTLHDGTPDWPCRAIPCVRKPVTTCPACEYRAVRSG